MLDRYRKDSAMHRIEGYLIPRPGESYESSFHRAKAETVKYMRRDLADVHDIVVKDFKP